MRLLAAAALAFITSSLLAAESSIDSAVAPSAPPAASGLERSPNSPMTPWRMPQPDWSLPALEKLADRSASEPQVTRIPLARPSDMHCYFIRQLNGDLQKPLVGPVFVPLASEVEARAYPACSNCLPVTIIQGAVFGR